MAADGGCERDVVPRMNAGCRAWGALKSVLSTRGLGIKAKKCLYVFLFLGSFLNSCCCSTAKSKTPPQETIFFTH